MCGIAGKRVELEADNQSGDSRTWERNRVTVVVDKREPERVVRKEVSDPQWIKILKVCGEHLLPSIKEQLSQSSGNERGFERVGQPLGPWRIKAPLTLGGGGGGPFPHQKRMPPWQMPRVDRGSDQWEARRPFWMTENNFRSHFSAFQINAQLFIFLQNGRRRPFWMTENHFRSQFSPFQINTQLFIFFQNGRQRPFWIPIFSKIDRDLPL